MVENSRQPAPGNRQLGCTVSLDLEPRLPRKAWSRKHFFFHFKRAPRKTICTDWGQFLTHHTLSYLSSSTGVKV